MRALGFVATGVLAGLAIAACSASSRSPGKASFDTDQDAGTDAAGAGGSGIFSSDAMPPKPSPDGGCGYEAIDVTRTTPNVYFVIDRSGSMGEVVGGQKKLDVVRAAVVSLAQTIGFRVNVGAAVFPTFAGGANYCMAGSEIVPLQPGDPKSFADQKKLGPVAHKLAVQLEIPPFGNTPTGPTLAALTPKLAALGGKGTYVILATDGGPNCGVAPCGADACIPNIEKVTGCTGEPNCCDPAMVQGAKVALCVDANGALSAVSSLAAAGVTVIVVGITGSAYYAGLLDALAVAGGAPRETSPRYYQVEDLSELEGTFAAIGSNVIVSCDLSLAGPPPEPNNVNVYLDDTLVFHDEKDGWTYSDPSTITLHGASCAALEAGKYSSAQVFLGCPTVMPPVN